MDATPTPYPDKNQKGQNLSALAPWIPDYSTSAQGIGRASVLTAFPVCLGSKWNACLNVQFLRTFEYRSIEDGSQEIFWRIFATTLGLQVPP